MGKFVVLDEKGHATLHLPQKPEKRLLFCYTISHGPFDHSSRLGIMLGVRLFPPPELNAQTTVVPTCGKPVVCALHTPYVFPTSSPQEVDKQILYYIYRYDITDTHISSKPLTCGLVAKKPMLVSIWPSCCHFL